MQEQRLFGVSLHMRRKLHKNELFRVLHCHLSIEETAKLCDVSLMQVKKWDAGYKPIPAIKRKLMELYSFRSLDPIGWKGWYFQHGILHSEMGYKFEPQMLECMAIMNTTDPQRWLVAKTEYAATRRKRKGRNR